MELVTRQRPAIGTDGYGDPITDWTTPTVTLLWARGVEPVSSSEDNDGRQAVITGFRVYLPSDADVLAGDRVLLRGATYDVDGQPADWRSPSSSGLGGLVVALKRVVG